MRANLLASAQAQSISGKKVLLAFIMMIFQIVATLGVVIAEYLPTEGGILIIDHDWSQTLLCIYMSLSVFGMLLFLCTSPIFIHDDDDDDDDGDTEVHSNQYLTASVYVFGMGTIFLRLQELYTYTYCSDLKSDIPFALFSLIYTFIQMACLQLLNSKKIAYHCVGYFSFFSFIGTNISQYIIYIPFEMHLEVASSHIESDDGGKCITVNNTIPFMFEKWKHMLVPFVSEFSLIGIGVLFTIIRSVRIPSNVEIFRTPPTSLEPNIQQPHIKKSSPTWNPGVLFGITLGFLVLTTSMAAEEQKTDEEQVKLWVHYSFVMGVGVIQLITLVILHRNIDVDASILLQIRADDVLIIFSLIGPLVWDILVVIAAGLHFHPDSNEDIRTSVTAFLCNLFQIFTVGFQTLVLIEYQHKARKFQNRDGLKQLLYFLTTVNLRFWVIDSFIGLKTSSQHVYPMPSDVYASAWPYVSSVLYVLSIFHRFHAALISYEITVSKFENV